MDVGQVCMFFAGLILLIPHRIGMSRVNYVIKRYNLPISRAGLLLYKYHNNIELSLLLGTLPGNIIVWTTGLLTGPMYIISIFMIFFLSLMLISSIIMYIIYISGGDFGHLNAFYFSLIFLTLFDGFANAFAFGINAKYSSLLSAGIPLSGFLVTLLHYTYKYFSDLFHWDDFDYYVLRLQLICNIIIILIAILLWFVDLILNQLGKTVHTPGDPLNLFNTMCPGNDKNFKHIGDWSPILLLAISLGTVYAFYPSIAPYSIIDFQYASVIELWILIISALLPLTFALADNWHTENMYGPSGHYIVLWPDAATTPPTLTVTGVKHTTGFYYLYHGGSKCPQFETATNSWKTGADAPKTNAHAYGNYKLTTGDLYYDGSKKHPLTKLVILKNWFYAREPSNPNDANATWSQDTKYKSWCWNLVWICAIFYILCIQIFMSLLHYPHCLLSCFCNNHPYFISFISILFNTLRELMQAFGFAGAGKQAELAITGSIYNTSQTFNLSTAGKIKTTAAKLTTAGQVALTGLSGFDTSSSTVSTSTINKPPNDNDGNVGVNGTIAATNKLITLFVMMFCVFTGDGYLQHYRRCCRDCWPTTGYTKYQSFFYWLHFGFKGGIKSITSSFTDLYYHNLRPQFISYT